MKKLIIALVFILNIVAMCDNIEEMLSIKEIKKVEKMKSYDAVVSKIKGQAFIRYQKELVWRQLVKGDKIPENSTVITLDDSELIIKLKNESYTEIGANTRAVFNSLKSEPTKESMTDTEIELFFGKVFSNIKRTLETGSRYEIKTSSATAGVRGTQFSVIRDKNGNTDFIVYRGKVEIKRDKLTEPIFINDNERVNINNKGELKLKEKHKEKPPINNEFNENENTENIKVTSDNSETLNVNLKKDLNKEIKEDLDKLKKILVSKNINFNKLIKESEAKDIINDINKLTEPNILKDNPSNLKIIFK